jgi:hypothetical protein
VTNLDPAPETTGSVVETRERRQYTDRQVARTCARCEAWIPYTGVGRIPKYCSQNCRQRAYELRTAEARHARDVEAGRATDGPVREVVERTETITRTVVRQAPPEVVYRDAPRPAAPESSVPRTAEQWLAALRDLQLRVEDDDPELLDHPLWPDLARRIRFLALLTGPALPTPATAPAPAANVPQESRQQRRARERMERKAAAKKRH